jgi:hypothetical protein
MDLTSLIAKVLGPVLLLRALSMLFDRKHFVEMVRGLGHEVTTVSFSGFAIALLMICITLVVLHSDTSGVAAILIHIIAWGAILEASGLILFRGSGSRGRGDGTPRQPGAHGSRLDSSSPCRLGARPGHRWRPTRR